MEEPTTYLGASSRHVICENYTFQLNVVMRIFKCDEVYSNLTWLDIKNCNGLLDKNTFKNLPNLEILNIINCKFEGIEDHTFSTLKNLKSIDVSRSTFPLTQNSFNTCENLENLRLIKLENNIPAKKVFRNTKKLEYIMFHHMSGLDLTKDMFGGLESLTYLFITKCTVENIDDNVFEQLKNLEVLYFTGNSLKKFTCDSFVNLKHLRILGIYDNVTSTENFNPDYDTLKNLPLLETISFPEEVLKNMDFKGFKSLKNVQLVVDKSSDDILEFLKKKNLNVEWTVDMDYSKEPDFSDANIQICT